MVMNLCCHLYGFCKRRNDEHCFQFQSGRNHLPAKAGQVILVSPRVDGDVVQKYQNGYLLPLEIVVRKDYASESKIR